MQKNPLASLPILVLFYMAFKMQKLFNQLVVLAICLVIILGVVYFVSWRIRHVGLVRATVPCFVSDAYSYRAKMGGLNLLDIMKIGALFLAIYFGFVNCGNIISEKVICPPSPIAKAMRATLSTITNIPEELIDIEQKSPEWLRLINNPKFLIDDDFCRENEFALESGCHVDFTDFVINRSGELWIKFESAQIRKRRLANIWIVQQDGSMVQDGRAHAYGYVLRNRINSTVKVGFARTVANVKKRFAEHARHVPSAEIMKIFPLRSLRDETAIRKRLESLGANLNEPDEAGRELFDATTPGVMEYLNSLEEVYEETA